MTGDLHSMLQPMGPLTHHTVTPDMEPMVTAGGTVTPSRMVMQGPAQTRAAAAHLIGSHLHHLRNIRIQLLAR